MVDLRVSYRRKGLSDVYIRNSCPPIRAGIVCSVAPKSIWVKDWLFIPTQAFARKYPASKKWRVHTCIFTEVPIDPFTLGYWIRIYAQIHGVDALAALVSDNTAPEVPGDE